MQKPALKPVNPNFSSGPCSKRPGYALAQLDTSTQGRSHRAPIGKAALNKAVTETARLLELPSDYRVGIVPASDTGAVEMALWSMLGARPVTMMAWESFGAGWVNDVCHQLRLKDVTRLEADYGQLPDLSSVDWQQDVVFTWNGTTSGVKVPNGNWIAGDRAGLAICDATSAVFAQPLPWQKLDVVTFSWQKVLGGEGAHGMLILSPRAVERLENYQPPWPLPKLFRMTKNGKLIEGIFRGDTINTPSMLCVSDYLDALAWVDSVGGQRATQARCDQNAALIEAFVAERDWINLLARDPSTYSNTSVCLTLACNDEQIKHMIRLLEEEGVAFDIAAYRDAPNGLRIWCGATVEASDIAALLPWLDWAFEQAIAQSL